MQMEILFVSHKYPPSVGGMEKQSFELINGIKSHVVTHAIIYEGSESRIQFFLRLNRRILEKCKTHPAISIIHFNDALIAAWSLRHSGYKHLKQTVTVHGLDIVFPNIIYRKYILPKFSQFDKIFAVSTATAQACIERRIDASKIVVINNGVDESISKNTGKIATKSYISNLYGIDLNNRKLLIAMGRPVERKGFSWFIENVLPKLDAAYLMLIIGSMPRGQSFSVRIFQLIPSIIRRKLEFLLGWPSDAGKIRKLLNNGQYINSVRHLGKLPFEQVTQLLGLAEAFVVPNIPVKGDMEGFGLVTLEAGRCGTKVFASAIEGLTDAIEHGKNGFLLPAGDATTWAEVLNNSTAYAESLLWNSEDSIRFIHQKFSWKKMVEAYLVEFNKILL
jgi:glycosyltransferase involved in cell wall biosynthesis